MGTWGTELWDKTDTIIKHTHLNVESFDKCAAMLKERMRIEQDYSKALRRLVKQFASKKKDDDQQQQHQHLAYSFQRSLKCFLERTEHIASIKDNMVENISCKVVKEMQKISQEAKTERKKSLHKLSESRLQLEQQFKALTSAKKKYDQASEESHHALKVYEAADQSLDQTRVQILKHQRTSQEKG